MVEVREEGGIGPQVLVREVERYVSKHLTRVATVTDSPEAELCILEEPPSCLWASSGTIDVGLGHEGERAVRTQAKVSKAYGLGTVHDQRGQRKEDLAGQLGVRFLVQVVCARVCLREQALDVISVRCERPGEAIPRESIDRAHVARGLEGDRRDLVGVGERR